jgi:hypothetical protein
VGFPKNPSFHNAPTLALALSLSLSLFACFPFFPFEYKYNASVHFDYQRFDNKSLRTLKPNCLISIPSIEYHNVGSQRNLKRRVDAEFNFLHLKQQKHLNGVVLYVNMMAAFILVKCYCSLVFFSQKHMMQTKHASLNP